MLREREAHLLWPSSRILQLRQSLIVVHVSNVMFAVLVSAGCNRLAADDLHGPGTTKHFETKVRPLLLARCVKCHGPKEQKAKLRLDSAQGLFKGGESGPIVVPGDPDKSRMIQRIRARGEKKMPPDTRLSKAQIVALEQWIKQGAVWPGYKGSTVRRIAKPSHTKFSDEQKAYWAFQPVVNAPIPTVTDSTWPTSPIDHFILAKLRDVRLHPAPPATRRTFIRRATFDLVGLPPTPEEVEEFLLDDSPDAFAKVVDRLLGSPHYGQRWGRHWLDVVRYADTLGQEADWVLRYAFRYRDYVIDSYNSDKPYNEFIIEQLAGDLLPKTDDLNLNAERVIATGFLMLSPKATAEADKELMVLDVVDEQIDVTGRAFIGLTIACARCHDHKFDPIPTLDYYSIAGIFRSTQTMIDFSETTSRWVEFPLTELVESQRRWLHEKFGNRLSQLGAALRSRESQPVSAQVTWEKQLRAGKLKEPATGLPAGATDSLVLWLDGSDIHNDDGKTNPKNGQPVSLWNDKSNNGNHASSLPTPNDPSFVAAVIGDRPVVRFGGDSFQALRKANPKRLPGGNSGRSLFVVAIPRNPKHNGKLRESISHVVGWGSHTKTNSWNLFQLVNGQTWLAYHGNDIKDGVYPYRKDAAFVFEQQHVADSDGGESKTTIWKDGRLDGSFTPKPVISTDDTKPLVIGAYNFLGGQVYERAVNDVAEVILYNRALTSAERNQVGHYLAQKYALRTGYVSSLQLVEIPVEQRTPQQRKALKRYYLENHDPVYKKLLAEVAEVRRNRAEAEAALSPTMVMAPREDKPRDLHVYLRGNYNDKGELAPRRFLQIIAGENHAPIKTEQSGRLELARWIAGPSHPLTARVMVNRIWQGHFGRGLVPSSDNFGVLGGAPSHPKLLDWLASRFVESGWSIKAMHRLILLSSTYQQSSHLAARDEAQRSASPARQQASEGPPYIDPQNRLLWRMPRRRLEAEAIRDAILVVSDRLNRTMRGPVFENWWQQAAIPVDVKRGLIALAEPAANIKAFKSLRRSVYLPVIRNQQFEMFKLFDYADASSVLTKRTESTVAPQALFLLNSPFVKQQSKHFARNVLSLTGVNDVGRLHLAHRTAFGRPPKDDELEDARDFLRTNIEAFRNAGRSEADSRLAAWESYCHVLFCQNEFIYVE